MGGLEVQVLECGWQWEPDDAKSVDLPEENTEKEQRATCEVVVAKLEAVPGTIDDIEETYGNAQELSGKIYNYLVKNCTEEAFGIVRSVESGDGVEAWVKLHQKYSQRTMSRMMRVLMECMYPKEAKAAELTQAVLQWEVKWNQMMKDQPGGTCIPELWRMAALMKMCPKEIKHNIEISWDTIDEKYSVMREKVVMWATNAAEKAGGAVHMDVSGVEDGREAEWGQEGVDHEEWSYGAEGIDAVYPTTKCYNCQGYGHMARECPTKGKGKGAAKGGGKGSPKGGAKGDLKGRGKGGWNGAGVKGFGKDSKGKGKGYQAECYRCGKVGHKAAECYVYMVGETAVDGETAAVDSVNGVPAEPWIVGSVTEEIEDKKLTEKMIEEYARVEGVPEWQAEEELLEAMEFEKIEQKKGKKEDEVDAEGIKRITKKKPRKVKFMSVYSNPMKIDTGCEGKCCCGEEMRKPMERTLDVWMPKRIEVKTKNMFEGLQVNGVDEEDEEDIAAVNDEENEGIVKVTVDSGAARSVWPRRKKGVLRRKLEKKPKLVAANGTKIQVYGEAVLEFDKDGKDCGMRFLDSDVKKPLAAVSAINDEGNTVVFSKKWGNYIENDVTGERIMIERVGDTFELHLKAKKMKEGTKKEVKWAEDGGKKYQGMDVDANDEDEEMLEKVIRGKKGETVFRRLM